MVTTVEKILFGFIIALPIIDIVTTFTNEFALSFGAVVRTVIMLFLFIFLVQHAYRNRFIDAAIFCIPFLTIVLTFLLNYFLKEPFLLRAEVQFFIKMAYYVTMLFTALFIIEKRNVHRQTILSAATIASMIIGVSYWISVLTKTNIKSYTFIKSGYSGWFYSANELSVIVIILLALVIVQFYVKPSWQAVIAYSLLLSLTPMIGTKTAFYGGILIAFSYVLLALFSKKHKMNIALIAITVLFIFFLPNTPFMANTTTNVTNEQVEQLKVEQNVQLLSSRDVYLAETKADYEQAPLLRKLFGLGYAGNYETNPKTIEMDVYDLFFSYGIIGTMLLLMPLILVLKKVIVLQFSVPYFLLVLTCLLCVGIASVAGHVLFAPAVMSYVFILVVVTALFAQERRAISHE